MTVHRVLAVALVLVVLGTIAQPVVSAASHSTTLHSPWYGASLSFFSWLMYLVSPDGVSYTGNGPGDQPTPSNGNG